MKVTERKKKTPPTFQYLPKSRAKRLKKSWIEDHKIRSKWKAQKRREGLRNQTSAPVEDASNHVRDETSTNSDSEPATSPDRLEVSSTSTSSHDKQSRMRDLRRIAYAFKSIPTQKSDSSSSRTAPAQSCNNRDGEATVRRETGQPNMKLRMNVLLEKIKRDLS